MTDVLDELREKATDTEDTAPRLSSLLSRAVAEIERLREATRWRYEGDNEYPPQDQGVVVFGDDGKAVEYLSEDAVWMTPNGCRSSDPSLKHWLPITPLPL